MDIKTEKQLYLEMLGELTATRRTITEEILVVRKKIDELDKEYERATEYMSANEYIKIRNNIRAEVEKEMREQLKEEVIQEKKNPPKKLEKENTEQESEQELEQEPKQDEPPSPAPAPVAEEMEQKKAQAPKQTKRVSRERISSIAGEFLKEKGIPTPTKDLKKHLEEEHDLYFSDKQWNQKLWEIKQMNDRIMKAGRGYLQYKF